MQFRGEGGGGFAHLLLLLLLVKDRAVSERCKSSSDVCLKGGHVSTLGVIKTMGPGSVNYNPGIPNPKPSAAQCSGLRH